MRRVPGAQGTGRAMMATAWHLTIHMDEDPRHDRRVRLPNGTTERDAELARQDAERHGWRAELRQVAVTR